MIEALHLFANHKITGPAELALETARWLPLVAADVQTRFYSSVVADPSETKDRWLQALARERHLQEPSWDDILLPKHFSPLAAYRDIKRLTRHFKADGNAIVHAHTANDHLLAGVAAWRCRPGPVVIRTLYDGECPASSARTRLPLTRLTQRLICLSSEVADAITAPEYGMDRGRVHVLAPPIDTRRFDPERPLPDLRARLGITPSAPVYGIVARMQTHRRFEMLIEAMKIVALERPKARAIIVGRGTNQEIVARRPVSEAGLSEQVLFSGYLSGDDYVGVLKALDLKLFLVPGSDGSCRAVREALSMGVPVIATRRGMLPELVRDGETGRLITETAEALAAAILSTLADRERLRIMADAARADALARFDFANFARAVAQIYRDALADREASRA